MTKKEQRELQRVLRTNLKLLGEIAQLSADGKPVGPETVALATQPVSMLMDIAFPNEAPTNERKTEGARVTFSEMRREGSGGETFADIIDVSHAKTNKKLGELIRLPQKENGWRISLDLKERYEGGLSC